MLEAKHATEAEEDDEMGTSIARLDALRRAERDARVHRLQALVASNNNGVGAFYKAVRENERKTARGMGSVPSGDN